MQKIKTYFILNNLKKKIVLFMWQRGKIWLKQTCFRWEYLTVRARCVLH